MSRWRNLTNDEVIVVYGTWGRPRVVVPDGVVDVEDDADQSYACQPLRWSHVDMAPPAAPAPEPAPVPDVAGADVARDEAAARLAADEAALAEAQARVAADQPA